MSEWQAIESAPKDETSVQVWCRVSGWGPRAWFDPENPRRGWGYTDSDWAGTWVGVYPTHWMPLPAPPRAASGEE
jgi:hypothetical protein